MDRIADRALNVSPSLTLAINAKGIKMRAEGKDVISFGAGEPDFNTPDYININAKEAIDKGCTKYTSSAGTVDLRKAICSKFKKDNNLVYSPSQIVVSNGAKHSLYNALLATINPGDEVIIPAPYWLTYPELVKLCDGVPVFIEAEAKNDFKLTPEQLAAAITTKTKAIIFNNPSNPTGAVYNESEIRCLATVLEKADIYIISDEIYEKLSYEDKPFSIAAVSDKLYQNTIVVNGVSKSFAMTGWRIGYTGSSEKLAKAMDSMQSHTTSNANSIAQYATVAALTEKSGEVFLHDMFEVFDRRRKLMIQKLDEIKKLSYIMPKGAFYVMLSIENLLGKTLDGITINSAVDFSNLLIDREAVVSIPCESFGAPMYVRLSYATSEDNIIKGMDRIRKLVDALSQ